VFLPAAKRAGGAEKEIALQQKNRAPFVSAQARIMVNDITRKS
jgi:hypothetical protein